MPTLTTMRLPPPKAWQEFEDLVLASLGQRWKTTTLQRNGRSGQAQTGVDVYGSDDIGRRVGIQCKNFKGALELKTVKKEIERTAKFKGNLSRSLWQQPPRQTQGCRRKSAFCPTRVSRRVNLPWRSCSGMTSLMVSSLKRSWKPCVQAASGASLSLYNRKRRGVLWGGRIPYNYTIVRPYNLLKMLKSSVISALDIGICPIGRLAVARDACYLPIAIDILD
jgi:hypothetical protein